MLSKKLLVRYAWTIARALRNSSWYPFSCSESSIGIKSFLLKKVISLRNDVIYNSKVSIKQRITIQLILSNIVLNASTK